MGMLQNGGTQGKEQRDCGMRCDGYKRKDDRAMAIPFAPASPKWGFTITAGPAPLACFWLGCASVDSPFHLLADKAVALKLKLSWVLGLPRERFPVLDPPAGLCSSGLGEFPDIPPVSEFHWPLAYTQSTGLFKSRASNSTVSTGTSSRRVFRAWGEAKGQQQQQEFNI